MSSRLLHLGEQEPYRYHRVEAAYLFPTFVWSLESLAPSRDVIREGGAFLTVLWPLLYLGAVQRINLCLYCINMIGRII